MTIPYINIHTHHLSKDNGVYVFNNRFGFDKEIYIENYFSIGIHPWDAALKTPPLSELENTIQHPNCFAVGECGLDKVIEIDLEIQKKVFISQLDLAVKFQKPVIIHCVKAFDELIEICKSYKNSINFIIHGYHKSSQLAEQLIKSGFYISFNHSIFKKEKFDVSSLPLEKLFLETDTNTGISIEEVYKLAAVKFNVSLEELKEKISLNFKKLNTLEL